MKKIVITVLFIALWGWTGYLNYGYTLGYFTYEYPDQYHNDIAIQMAVGGPFAFPASYWYEGDESHKHWLTTPLTKEQRWESFHKQFPHLSREYFEGNRN